MKYIEFPKGFRAVGLNCQIKKEKLDLAILLSDTDANAGVVYTNNIFQAAPLQVTKQHILNKGTIRAIIVNSGVANAAMGQSGYNDAEKISETLAEVYHIGVDDIIVASTGVIGIPLPVDKIKKGIIQSKAHLAPLQDSYLDIEQAILTTDTVAKDSALTILIGDIPVHIWGMAKGSGMIHPNMSTMLGFICTDVNIAPDLIQKALTDATNDSFNMISVDGDTSTNDMVAVLANGQAKNSYIENEGQESYKIFKEALTKICQSLAKQIVKDGEGATKIFEVQVKGACSINDAKLIARSVCSSNLVKAAIFGKDANWGRIACAAGYSGAKFNPDLMNIYIGNLMVAKNGQGLPFDEASVFKLLSEETVYIVIDVGCGSATATAWGCDLTYDYVTINADYRS